MNNTAMEMLNDLLHILKFVPILIAAILIGNWFLKELNRARALRKPWYAPYLTVPGVMILLALLLPLVIRFVN
jgi:hypothetical protein